MKSLMITTCALSALIAAPAANAQVFGDLDSRGIVGTVIGSGLGGVLGSNIAGSGVQDEGTAIGAVVGGLAGMAIANRTDRYGNGGFIPGLNTRNTLGAGIGAGLGGVIGSNLAGSGVQQEGTAIGAVLGGLAGAAIANRTDRNRGGVYSPTYGGGAPYGTFGYGPAPMPAPHPVPAPYYTGQYVTGPVIHQRVYRPAPVVRYVQPAPVVRVQQVVRYTEAPRPARIVPPVVLPADPLPRITSHNHSITHTHAGDHSGGHLGAGESYSLIGSSSHGSSHHGSSHHGSGHSHGSSNTTYGFDGAFDNYTAPTHSYSSHSYSAPSVSHGTSSHSYSSHSTGSSAPMMGECPAGTTPQSDGTCLQGSSSSVYTGSSHSSSSSSSVTYGSGYTGYTGATDVTSSSCGC